MNVRNFGAVVLFFFLLCIFYWNTTSTGHISKGLHEVALVSNLASVSATTSPLTSEEPTLPVERTAITLAPTAASSLMIRHRPDDPLCDFIGGCERRCHKTRVEKPFDPTAIVSKHKKLKINRYFVENVCVVDGVGIVYFDQAGWNFKIYGDIGWPVLIPMYRYEHVRKKVEGNMPTTVEWAEGPAILHTIPHRYYMNLAHASDYISAQLNAIDSIMPYSKASSYQGLEWVFLMNQMQYDYSLDPKTTNFYRIYGPYVASFCRDTVRFEYNTKKGEKPQYPLKTQCFRKALIGLDMFLISLQPQNFTVLRKTLLDAILPTCSQFQKFSQYLLLNRNHTYRRIHNAEELADTLTNGLNLKSVNQRFEIVDFATWSFEKQFCAVSQALMFVGSFGAGLTWGFALPPKSVMLMFCPFVDRKDGCQWYTNTAGQGVHTVEYRLGRDELVDPSVFSMKVRTGKVLASVRRFRR